MTANSGPAADRQSLPFGVNRAALYSFREADHGDRDGSSLRAYAQVCAAERDIDLTAGRVLRRALNTIELLRAFFVLPLVTLKIVAAIHWEALRL
jgi:DUF1365 family protein